MNKLRFGLVLSVLMVLTFLVVSIPQQVAIMEFAQKVATQAHCIGAQEIATLRGHGLADAEIMDEILAVAARNFFSTVLLATGAEPDEIYADLRLELEQNADAWA